MLMHHLEPVRLMTESIFCTAPTENRRRPERRNHRNGMQQHAPFGRHRASQDTVGRQSQIQDLEQALFNDLRERSIRVTMPGQDETTSPVAPVTWRDQSPPSGENNRHSTTQYPPAPAASSSSSLGGQTPDFPSSTSTRISSQRGLSGRASFENPHYNVTPHVNSED
jgi:hypothetical protein